MENLTTSKDKAKLTLYYFGLLMKRHRVTQEQIGEKLGIRQQSVGAMLKGKFYPTLDTLYKYMQALNEVAGTFYTLANIDPERYSHTFFMVTGHATPMLVPTLEKIPNDPIFASLLVDELDGALRKGIYFATDDSWALVVGGELKVLEEAKRLLEKRL